jgi:cystathionine beta-lyase
MTFDFDKTINRWNTGSLKWDRYKCTNIIPMWVADMDFQAPPVILEALCKHVEHGVFGYAVPKDELVEVVVNRLKAKYHWEIKPSWIVWLPGIVPALNVVCRTIGSNGDEVLTFIPVYPPFLSAPTLSSKTLKTVPLCRNKKSFTFDLERFEKEISSKSKLLLLCNPHNPVGRAFTKEEIRNVAEICLKHDIVLCSDEIHCDLILDNKEHIPLATLSSEISANTITLMAPSKTFNVPGLNCAFAVIPDEALRTSFITTRRGIVPDTNALGYTACLAAYKDCEEWRVALIDYLRKNRDIVYHSVNQNIPNLSMDHVEATYLAWINTKELNISDPASFFERAGVGLSDGRHFQGERYVRLNFGCPRKTLLEALDRMKRAIMKPGNLTKDVC